MCSWGGKESPPHSRGGKELAPHSKLKKQNKSFESALSEVGVNKAKDDTQDTKLALL